MEIEISGLFLRVVVDCCVAAAGLLVALCVLGSLASRYDRNGRGR